MQHTPLHRHILEKNLVALAEDLQSERPEVIEELDNHGDSFKTLAIKTLNEQEFDIFCDILQNYYITKIVSEKPECMACRVKVPAR